MIDRPRSPPPPPPLPAGAFRPAALIAGVDEAGRGPWAGPVVAAALVTRGGVLGSDDRHLIRDSKTLSRGQREAAFEYMMREGLAVGIGAASAAEIDRLNILRASLLAMHRALGKLNTEPDMILVDGPHVPPDSGSSGPASIHAVIRGDSRHRAIAGASIIAKVIRDRIMTKLDRRYPHFSWESNAGYGTRAHRQALDRFGPTPHHRRSFRPVAAASRGGGAARGDIPKR